MNQNPDNVQDEQSREDHFWPKDQLVAIGAVTTAFSALEHTLHFFVWSLIGRDQHLGQIVTAQLPFRTIQGLAGALFHHRYPDSPIQADLDSALKRIAAVEERRNTIIHSVWPLSQNPTQLTRFKHRVRRREGYTLVEEQLTADEIMAVASEISEVTDVVQNIHFRTAEADPTFTI